VLKGIKEPGLRYIELVVVSIAPVGGAHLKYPAAAVCEGAVAMDQLILKVPRALPVNSFFPDERSVRHTVIK
jgi:hypothetical protein